MLGTPRAHVGLHPHPRCLFTARDVSLLLPLKLYRSGDRLPHPSHTAHESPRPSSQLPRQSL